MILSPERASFDKVTDAVYLGSRIATLDDFHRIRSFGVRACVDMKEEGADLWPFEAFLWLPTRDHSAPSPAHFGLGIAFLRECERSGMAVVVQCLMGVGRSSTLVLAYLLAGPMREAGMRAALEFLYARRPVAHPNPEQVAAAELAARAFTT